MRSILFFITIILFIPASAQLATDNFNTYPTGDIATDPTGATAGSTGYFITGGAASDYQITSIDAIHGNSLKITSGTGFDSGIKNPNDRFAMKPVSVPTPGASDEVIQANIEIFTTPKLTGASGLMTFDLLDANGEGVIGIGIDFASRRLLGLLRLTPNSPGATPAYYSAYLGTISYNPNIWISLKIYYVRSSGVCYWSTPAGKYGWTNTQYLPVPNLNFTQYTFSNYTTTGNTTSNIAIYDNVVIKYNTLANADVDDVQNVGLVSNVNIYPNPATKIVKIDTDEKILSVQLYDLTGKQINVNSTEGVVDVSNLSSGDYILNVTTDVGVSSHKIIKK